jgi:glucosamine-6-phosphate deaminase
MEVLIRRDAGAVADEAFQVVEAELKRKPGLVVGLATGRTPLALYGRMRRLDWSRASFFNLDEYVGLGAAHAKSFARYLDEHLLSHVKAARVRLYRGDAADLEAECAEVEREISAAGGIDLQILGIGADGHIGYNEPTSSFGSRTRIKTLAAETIQEAGGGVPFHAITMGIGTILEAKRLLLLATGASKAAAVAAAVEGPLAAMCPASALQLHARATLVIDEEAAGKLARRDYYRFVDRNKPA